MLSTRAHNHYSQEILLGTLLCWVIEWVFSQPKSEVKLFGNSSTLAASNLCFCKSLASLASLVPDPCARGRAGERLGLEVLAANVCHSGLRTWARAGSGIRSPLSPGASTAPKGGLHTWETFLIYQDSWDRAARLESWGGEGPPNQGGGCR